MDKEIKRLVLFLGVHNIYVPIYADKEEEIAEKISTAMVDQRPELVFHIGRTFFRPKDLIAFSFENSTDHPDFQKEQLKIQKGLLEEFRKQNKMIDDGEDWKS